MADYITRDQRVILTQEELDALKALLDAGDRGGFYMTYNAMTDSAHNPLPRKRGREFRLISPIPLLIAPMRVPASG